MSITVTVPAIYEVVDLRCCQCGGIVTSITSRDGTHYVEACETCMEIRTKEAYDSGFDDAKSEER